MNTFESHSPQLNELFAALSKAQAMILAAAKDKQNPYYKSRYSDLSSVWEAIREPLTQNGLTILQPFGGPKDAMVLETWIGHVSGQWMKSIIHINPLKPDPQSLGSLITYLRRYALCALVGVVSDEDDDGNLASRKATVGPGNKPIDEKKMLADFLSKVVPEDDQNEEDWAIQYLTAHAKINKCSLAMSIQKYEDIEKFKQHLALWKEKQIKEEE